MRKRVLMLLLAALAGLLLAPAAAFAKFPYSTFYMDTDAEGWQLSQAIYAPGRTIALALEEPVDLYIDARDQAYIVDRKANQVLVVDAEGNKLYAIGDEEGTGKLDSPEGVFVDQAGTVYVADTGHQRIAIFSSAGKFVREIVKPQSEYLPQDAYFVPSKLVVDKRGAIYVAISGSDQGLMRLDKEGQYTGAFGANKAVQSYSAWLKRLILNKEQLAKEVAIRPRPVVNMAIDRHGFIYTASAGYYPGNIRKLNPGGFDSLRGRGFWHTVGLVDLAVDHHGFIYGLDLDSGTVTIYARNGDALFAFGDVDTNSRQRGILGYPTAIAVNSKQEIWVADSRLRNIQTFVQTAIGETALTATSLYMDGHYAASEPYWQQVRMHNEMYNATFQGLGRVAFEQGRHAEALGYFRTAFDAEGYSKAMWELRFAWLQQNLLAVLAGAAAVILAIKYGYRWLAAQAARRTWPPYAMRLLQEWRDFKYVLLHPYEGFYKLKERSVSAVTILLIWLLAVGLKLLHIYGTGFVFHPVDLSQVNLWSKLAFFIAPWITWIIANYLVCSVRGGEGRLREVIQASTYALAPYLFFSIPIVILTNIAVLEERVLVDVIQQVMVLWLLAMFFVSTQVIHNFDFLETLGNGLISVLVIVLIWFLAFILSGLSFNLYDFGYQLYREVMSYG